MEISSISVEVRKGVYWRSRAQESRETAKRMVNTGPRQGMLQIAGIYEKLATLADLGQLPPALRQGPRP